jgi:hypothetical protein
VVLVEALTEMTPATWLTTATRSRAWSGRQRIGLAIAYAVGALPGLLFVGLMRSPGYGDLPSIAALFVLGPAVTSAIWSSIDRDGADARELLMWLTSINKTRLRQPIPDSMNLELENAIIEASEKASRGEGPSAVLELVRSAVQRHFARPARMGIFVAYARFAPVLWWTVLSLVLFATFGLILFATPSCGPGGPSSFTICR